MSKKCVVALCSTFLVLSVAVGVWSHCHDNDCEQVSHLRGPYRWIQSNDNQVRYRINDNPQTGQPKLTADVKWAAQQWSNITVTEPEVQEIEFDFVALVAPRQSRMTSLMNSIASVGANYRGPPQRAR